MATWEFGGFAPTFNGPDVGTYTVLTTDTWSLDIGKLFTLDFGTASYSHQSPSLGGTGITFHTATGIYTGAGSVTAGTYNMVFRCSGSDTPPSYTDYSFTIQVNTPGTGIPPVFSGPIDDQSHAGDFTFDASAYFTGATSYSETPTVAGIAFNTGTGLFTITSATSGTGLFGPFTVQGINATGSTPTNPFYLTVLIPDTPGDFSDVTLQNLLDPGGNFTGIRIIKRHDPASRTTVNYYVVPVQHNPGKSIWVECLPTDDAAARANKIVTATTIPAQPIWPLP